MMVDWLSTIKLIDNYFDNELMVQVIFIIIVFLYSSMTGNRIFLGCGQNKIFLTLDS